MMAYEKRTALFLIVMALAVVMLPASAAHGTDIAGSWQLTSLTDNRAILFYFGSEGDFFVEDETSWIQGTYTIQPDTVPGTLDLYVQEGYNAEDAGKVIRYRYEIHDSLLTLSDTEQEADRPSILDMTDQNGRSGFIVVNTDTYDEDEENDDDANWRFYASCFLMSVMTE